MATVTQSATGYADVLKGWWNSNSTAVPSDPNAPLVPVKGKWLILMIVAATLLVVYFMKPSFLRGAVRRTRRVARRGYSRARAYVRRRSTRRRVARRRTRRR